MSELILALDQGTTSSRAILFDGHAQPVEVSQKEFGQIFPKPGWVEHDAEEIWQTQRDVALKALRNDKAVAIGITNQRETTVLWDRKTGKPIHHAIVWQDRRTSARCDQLRAQRKDRLIQSRTGLILDAYFSATKLEWLLDHVPGARKRAEKGELAFGTIDCWLLYKLTEGRVHATDASNASRTMLYNIHKGCWDAELLKLFRIPSSVLPEVKDSSGYFGQASALPGNIPIYGMAGDQQAALFGQGCNKPGMAKNTYGTGCFMLMNTGREAGKSRNKLLTTVAWQLDGQRHYALEGAIFIAGAVVQWLRDGLGIISHANEVEELARSVPDTGGVHLVPAFTGLGAPWWDQHARGTITGLTRGTTKAHLARAALESIALQTVDVLSAMQIDSGLKLRELWVDGGATANELLMQTQADLAGVVVVRPQVAETTALGAAKLAAMAAGVWKSVFKASKAEGSRFSPAMKPAARRARLESWHVAVDQTMTPSKNHLREMEARRR
ncbi:MAG: glycerol kinase GlpK [Verrucomicrobiaceae bacterium]|nr:glycerol kinase GlpK [Verrucomicrobiaceae bacterium]